MIIDVFFDGLLCVIRTDYYPTITKLNANLFKDTTQL